MRAAKNLCASRKKPVAMSGGGKVKNPMAKQLGQSKFKPKVVKPKKGKGSYTRKGKAMRKRLFNRIKAGNKGGASGQWSARKAQMMASAYKKAGGGYRD